MDFVRASMSEADRIAERHYETIKRATAEAIEEATRPRPKTDQ